MKFNKKLLSLFLVLMMLVVATACSAPAEEPVATMEVAEEAPPTETSEEAPAQEAGSLELAVNAYFENLPEHIYKISQVEFVQMVKDGQDMYILDIRTAEDYEKGHVEGAMNAPWGTAISDNLKNIPDRKSVV